MKTLEKLDISNRSIISLDCLWCERCTFYTNFAQLLKIYISRLQSQWGVVGGGTPIQKNGGCWSEM